uniref:(northern house mosquito) hypothetical protein n=1 Tax=Culex pipiens TaxID=7175 RepID=A0A8D8GFR2_CULPI
MLTAVQAATTATLTAVKERPTCWGFRWEWKRQRKRPMGTRWTYCRVGRTIGQVKRRWTIFRVWPRKRRTFSTRPRAKPTTRRESSPRTRSWRCTGLLRR